MGEKPLCEALKKRVRTLERQFLDLEREANAQREKKQRIENIIESAQIVTWEWNVQTGATEFNERWADIIGYTLEELAPVSINTWLHHIHPEDAIISQERLERHFSGKSDYYECELRMRHKNGRWIWVLDRGRVITWTRGGKPLCMQGTHQDITDRKLTEEALRESERRFRELAELLPEPIFEMDLNGKLTFVNQKAFEKFGYTHKDYESGIFALSMVSGKERKKAKRDFAKIVQGKNVDISEYEALRKDGTTFPSLLHSTAIEREGKTIGIRGFIVDITQKKQLEDRLRQSQKMEAIGTLAGGIAHDFNNILGIIIGNTELAISDIPTWHPSYENFKEIQEACLRARDLITQILLFARKKGHSPINIRPHHIAKESLKMLRASIPATVEIQQKIKENLPPILADPTQIQQIIMNLWTNAVQVMETQGGTLGFGVDAIELDAPLDTSTGRIPKGPYVRIQVSDTGAGITPENLDRIFEPFYTTKGVGQGTGLGLAVVHGIVQDRQGGITVKSEKDKGTTVTVLLPASDEDPAEENDDEASQTPLDTKHILFVDDEPVI